MLNIDRQGNSLNKDGVKVNPQEMQDKPASGKNIQVFNTETAEPQAVSAEPVNVNNSQELPKVPSVVLSEEAQFNLIRRLRPNADDMNIRDAILNANDLVGGSSPDFLSTALSELDEMLEPRIMRDFCEDENTCISFDCNPVDSIEVRCPDINMSPEEMEKRKEKPFVCKKEINVEIKDKKSGEVHKFTIPEGYTYDGASIPKFLHGIIGANSNSQFLIAAMVHDQLCENKEYVNGNRRLSSKVFEALLKKSGVGKFKAKLMTAAVDIYQRFRHWGRFKIKS